MTRDLIKIRNGCLYSLFHKEYELLHSFRKSIRMLLSLNVSDVADRYILKHEFLREYLEGIAGCKVDEEGFEKILEQPLFITNKGERLCTVSARTIILREAQMKKEA